MTDSTAAANKHLVRSVIEEFMNAGNLEGVDRYFAADYTVHIPGLENAPTGPEAFKKVVGEWLSAFPDWHMTVESLIAEGDLVATRFTTRGTHRGLLMGIPATGMSITVHSMDLHRLVNNRIQESWILDDVPTILMQIGVISPPVMGAGPSEPPPPGRD